MQINYLKGDATVPLGDGPKIIVHVCNDIGEWGKGFACRPLKATSPIPFP